MSPIFKGFKRHSLDVVEASNAHAASRLVLVDVREESERARRIVPASLHLPLSELRGRLHELPRDRQVAFICETGRRSSMAATAARRAGLDAVNVDGGMNAWTSSGLRTQTGGEGAGARPH